MSDERKLVLPAWVAPATQSLFEYWCSLKGDNIVPSRSQVRPAEMLSLLPKLMILEYHASGALIYRLIGTASVEKLGIDFTGSNLYDLTAPRQRGKAELRFNLLRNHPCGMIIHEKLRSKHQTPFVAELIYLPLRDRQGEITQLIGSAAVVKRGEKGSGTDEEAMTTIVAEFLDIGAGAPQSLTGDVRHAV